MYTKQIVIDLNTGRILYVGEGRGSDALEKFWRRIRRKGIVIKHVATDLSSAFTLSVLKNCPHAIHVFDHFHVINGWMKYEDCKYVIERISIIEVCLRQSMPATEKL